MDESRKFSDSLTFGQEGEHLIADSLIRSGYAVAPLYQFQTDGIAPVMLWRQGSSTTRSILPDLTVWSPKREAMFVEVKRKNRWVTYMDYLETGFNERHFRHYLELKNRLGAPVWIFFIHETNDPTGVFIGEVSSLAESVRVWDGHRPTMTVTDDHHVKIGAEKISQAIALFPIHALKKWATLEAIRNREAA